MRAEYSEAVEPCPFCCSENLYVDKDCTKEGYMEVCHECGEEMMLCEECLHAEDNPGRKCDWHEEKHDGISYGICFRGTTVHKEE